jgi:hypothetical protein
MTSPTTSPTTTASQTVTLAGEPGEDPLTITAAVVRVERKEETDFLGSRIGLDAHLQLTFPGDEHPHAFFLSRLVDEPCWVLDAHFGPNGYPHFSNGFGARYLKLRGIAAELEALLDQAACGLGLVEAIGPGVPLVLAEPATEQSGDQDQDRA